MSPLDIRTETRTLIERALAGDPALASLTVVGVDPETLTATIAPGQPTPRIGGVTWDLGAPFTRELLVEYVVRMQRLRWSRLDGYTMSIRPLPAHAMEALRQAYPRATHFECGVGWHDLLQAGLAWLDEIEDEEWGSSQIKEKMGTLRWYWGGVLSDVGMQIVDVAEHISGSICDRCGALGKRGGTGWISTRCEEHDDER